MKKKNYKYLLFDLDHTLWDFDKNSGETLDQLFYEFELDRKIRTNASEFVRRYVLINRELWKQYEFGTLTQQDLRIERFNQTLEYFGLRDRLIATEISQHYLAICPYKPHLIPKTVETLDLLHTNPEIKMIIITNGFAEVQDIKMKRTGLNKYFDHIITSETTGTKKPAGSIFKHAMDKIGGNRKESLMIGDSFYSDIIGARNFGIDQVYFNPERNKHEQHTPTFDITCISELLEIV